MSVLNDPKLEALLDALHAQSTAQDESIAQYFSGRAFHTDAIELDKGEDKEFLKDKLVALEKNKCEFCYQLCRALHARQVVEAGTSYGVSTLYLAAAMRDNGHGMVIGTEYETSKVKAARANFAAAGLSSFIDLREGDLRQTLKKMKETVDFVLIDIWTPLAVPALALVSPYLRSGAIVICDNTSAYRDYYRDYVAFMSEPANRFRTMTLPFGGGLELTVRVP